MLTLIKLVLWLACIGLWGATLAGMTAPLLPPFELINHFRPFPDRWRARPGACSSGPSARARCASPRLAGLALNLVLAAAPFLYSAPRPRTRHAPHLRVMTMNIWGRNREIDRMRDEILKQAPDVIVFQEFRSYHQPLLDALARDDALSADLRHADALRPRDGLAHSMDGDGLCRRRRDRDQSVGPRTFS